jgi:hypothetical protein
MRSLPRSTSAVALLAVLLGTTIGCSGRSDGDNALETRQQEATAPAWKTNTFYSVGTKVTFAGETWQCRQAHTSAVGWEPPNARTLWMRPTPASGNPWTDQTNYTTGLAVTFQGATWECIQGHVSQPDWTPTAAATLWRCASLACGGGGCQAQPDGRLCDDGNACTTSDKCKAGACVGTAKVCAGTGDQCKQSFCDARTGSCLAASTEGKPCNDGNSSTTGELCLSGTCRVPVPGTASCGAQDAQRAIFQRDTTAWQTQLAAEKEVKTYEALRDEDPVTIAFTDRVVIPVVFHVLHNPKLPFEVKKEHVVEQVRMLNEFYGSVPMVRKEHQGVAAATRIQFVLAKRSPTCQDTDGFEKIDTTVERFKQTGLDDWPWTDAAKGGAAAWDPKKYLNVWAAGYDPLENPNEVGQARFPWDAGKSFDGVVLNTRALPNPFTSFTLNAVLAHEVGHYLGLFHTDAPANTCAGTTAMTCDKEGDFICDTPPTKVGDSCTLPMPPANTCTETPDDKSDQIENIMLSSIGSCRAMFTAQQVTRMEATLAGRRSTLLDSDGAFPRQDPGDAWIRDGLEDDGSVPSKAKVLWASDDIWVRRGNDGLTNQVHENPLFRPPMPAPNSPLPNNVYVRVRNLGCAQSPSFRVTVRWAKASTSLGWPAPWDGTPPAGGGPPMGGIVGSNRGGSQILRAGESKVFEIPWQPPDPALYASFGGDQTHFCLLAHIGVSPPAQELVNLVKTSNDVAWKNVEVATDALPKAAVTVGGRSGPQRLLFDELDGLGKPDSLFDWGLVSVDLGPDLFALWDAGGRQGHGFAAEAIEGTRIFLLSSGATLENITMQPSDRFTIKTEFVSTAEPQQGVRGGLDVYSLQVTQLDEGTTPPTIVGGQRFDLKTRKPPGLPVQ